MTEASDVAHAAPAHVVEVLAPREVPLGGARAMLVRRTLPTRHRTLIGAWCFLDHYGPNEVREGGGMLVPPHPHTGLQTVSWLFAGEIEHRDSGGGHALIRPGLTGLMTSGYGIAHSEVSTPKTTVLHGVQLWVALPTAALNESRSFAFSHAPIVGFGPAKITVFAGRLLGVSSDVPVFTPLVGAEINIPASESIRLPVAADFEHGLLVDSGVVEFEGTILRPGDLGYATPGRPTITIANTAAVAARLVLIGGTPFDEAIVMWWNFVGRSHQDIVQMRAAWQAQSARFGTVFGYEGDPAWLPAPTLPNIHLLPRANPPLGDEG